MTTVKLGGIVVVFLSASDTIKLLTTGVVTRNMTIRGSTSASFEDLRNVLGLISSCVIQLLVEEIAFYDFLRSSIALA